MLIDTGSTRRATLVLAHGAGAGMDAPLLASLASGLAARGIEVRRFEFPYMEAARSTGKRRLPDRMTVLEEAYAAAVAEVPRDVPLFVGGKSLGGRVAIHVADRLGAAGVVAFGYPFHPPRQPQQLRLDALLRLRRPCLIVQGTRDPFGSERELAGQALGPHITLCAIADGDHDFVPRAKSGHDWAQNVDAACDAVTAFVGRA